MEIAARYYQSAAVECTWNYMRNQRDGNPCICIPTGGGKTIVIALMSRDCLGWGKRVLVATHSQELLLQGEKTLKRYDIDCGVYSAGLGRRDTEQKIVFCGIQSVYKQPHIFGRRDFVIVDECHRISDNENSMYAQFFRGLSELSPIRICGLTATPYRLGQGLICGEDNWLNKIVYEVGVAELIEKKFLCDIRSKAGDGAIDTSQLKIRGNDFSEADQETAFMQNADRIVADVHARATITGRKSILIFCAGVAQAQDVRERLLAMGEACGLVTADTPDTVRAEYIAAFRDQELRWLVNVNVLTEGFDAPGVDCVALLRATVSPGLYYQMTGRGLRLSDTKGYCLLLDYGENVKRHGPLNQITPPRKSGGGLPPTKNCPECGEILPAHADICTDCGFVFEKLEQKTPWEKINSRAADDEVIAKPVKPQWEPVALMEVRKHTPREEGKLPTLKLSFYANREKIGFAIAQQWLCVEHNGYARSKAEGVWNKLNPHDVCPTDSELAAVTLKKRLENGDIEPPTAILIKPDKANPKFMTILDYSWSDEHLPQDELDDDFGDKPFFTAKTDIVDDFYNLF